MFCRAAGADPEPEQALANAIRRATVSKRLIRIMAGEALLYGRQPKKLMVVGRSRFLNLLFKTGANTNPKRGPRFPRITLRMRKPRSRVGSLSLAAFASTLLTDQVSVEFKGASLVAVESFWKAISH